MVIRLRRKYKPEKEECMKKFIISIAMGLYVALSAGAVFASGNEQHQGRNHDDHDQNNRKIYGKVQSLPNGRIGVWNVNGKEIIVSQNTLIREQHGKAEVGAYVEVKGSSNGNTLNADKIEVKRDGTEIR
jgi:hypothetical protein